MGVDYLHLDCVQCVSLAEAARAVASALAREGWKPLGKGAPESTGGVPGDVRAVSVTEQGGWAVVDERDAAGFPVLWADKLAREERSRVVVRYSE